MKGVKGSHHQAMCGRCRQALDIRFNGSAINKSMLQAAAAVTARVDSACKQVIQQIENKYGRDVISGGYFKILRAVQFCEKHAADNQLSFPAALLFVFDGILYCLDMKKQTPKYFTQDALDRSSKGGGQPGWLLVTLAKMWLQQHISSIVEDMAGLIPQPVVVPELRKVLGWFESWSSFRKAFPGQEHTAAPAPETAEGTADPAGDLAPDTSSLDEKKKSLGKAAGILLEVLYCAYTGIADSHISQAVSVGNSVALTVLFSNKGGSV